MKLMRKRKGGKWPSFSSLRSQLSSDGNDIARDRKKCREEPKTSLEHDDPRKQGYRTRGVVLTAPTCSGSSLSSDVPLRGLKRKLGCIEPATRIGRKKKLEKEYILGREIGQGKFGSVRLCRSTANGEEFACKTLPKNGEETVHREVEIMQHLSGHPGVVTLNAVYDDSDNIYLIMELCSGGRLLDQITREGTYSEQKAAKLLKELILVIKYCHDMGVVHRDIKPENILLTTSGKMKLADFGLAVRVTNGNKCFLYCPPLKNVCSMLWMLMSLLQDLFFLDVVGSYEFVHLFVPFSWYVMVALNGQKMDGVIRFTVIVSFCTYPLSAR